MKRIHISSLAREGLALVMLCAWTGQGSASTAPSSTLKAISVSVPGTGNDLRLGIAGDYSYKALQATPDTLFVDLSGARVGQVARSGEWSGGLLTGYRLIEFTDSSHQAVVRVQVEMKHHEGFEVTRNTDSLILHFDDHSALSQPAGAMPSQTAVTQAKAGAETSTKPQPARKLNEVATVSGVTITPGPAGSVFVDVSTTQPTAYHVLQLGHPSRLVVDMDEARQSLHQKTFIAHSPLLSGVRVGQFREKNPAVVRVVADLSGDPVFDVHAQPGGIRIELKSHVQVSPSAANKVLDSLPPSRQGYLPKAFQATALALVPPLTPARSDATTTVTPAHPLSAQLSSAQVTDKASEPPPYQGVLPARAGAPEVSAAPKSDSPSLSPEALRASSAAQTLATSSSSKTTAFQAQAPGAPSSAEAQPHYTGDPISVNLKDVDLKDFFRLIHEISGLNIIVDPNVTGTVTIVLDNVPWDQALDIVLKDNQLGKTLEGNVLRISKIETLAAEQEAATKLVSAREDAQPLVTRFVPVNYAKAMTLQTMLKTWVGGGALSKRGNILVDDRTNTLIVSDIASQIPVLLDIISKLDTKTKQVSIEAKIIRTTADFARLLNSSLGVAFNNAASLTEAGTGGGSTATASSPAPSVKVPASITGFGVFGISDAGHQYLLAAALTAEETKSKLRVLSEPSIVTQNNVQGIVTQGVQIPIQTTINNTISISYAQASLTLTVTPQVTADGNIFMNIRVENSSVGAILTGAGPSINTQSATTQVLVPDGGTVVFGGVKIASRSHSDDYVPWLGQIPIFGHLFKNTNTTNNDQELMFFVTPRVLPG